MNELNSDTCGFSCGFHEQLLTTLVWTQMVSHGLFH